MNVFLRKFYFFPWFFAAITFTFTIGVENGYHYGPGLIFLSSFGLFFFSPKWSLLDRYDKTLFLIFLIFPLGMFFFAYIDIDGKLRDLDLPSRYLLLLPVLFILLMQSNKKEWLWYGIITSTFFALPITIYQRVVLGHGRASGWENAIHFGNVAMLLGLLSVVSAIYFYAQKKIFLCFLSILSVLFGMSISIASGTRGGWVAVPFILFFLLWESRDLFSLRVKKTVLVISSLLILLAISIPQTGVQNRILKGVDDIEYYFNGDPNTSVGLRFEMWKASWYMFKQSPILGVGASQTKPIRAQLAEQGYISDQAVDFKTSHNEFLEALSSRGVLGLFLLLGLYLVPLKLFLIMGRKYKNNWRIKPYALAGAIIPMCFMDFGLTMVMLSYSIGVTMFAFPIVYFWAAVRWAEREELAKAKA